MVLTRKKDKKSVQGIPRLGVNVIGALNNFGKRVEEKAKDAFKESTEAVDTAVKRTSRGIHGAVHKVMPKGFIPKQIIRPMKEIEAKLGSMSLKKVDKAEEEEKFLRLALKENFLFKDVDEVKLDNLVSAFETCEVKKDEYIFKEGEDGDFFYILYKGKVTFEQDDAVVATSDDYKPYCTFGEIALMHMSARPQAVHASTDCVLFRLDQVNFRLVVQKEGGSEDEKLVEFLRQVPALAEFDTSSLARLASAMEVHTFKKGEVVMEKGDPVNAFIVVHSGKLLCTDIDMGGVHYEDITIGFGENQQSIGLNSIINDTPIAGHVKAKTDVKVLAISADDFKTQVGKYEYLAARRGKHVQLSLMAIFKDSKLEARELNGLVDLLIPKNYWRRTTIFKQKDKVDAALYFVRKGHVEIKYNDDKRPSKTLENGAYFGLEQFLADQNKSGQGRALVRAEYTVIASGDTELDVLLLEDTRAVIDTRVIGLGKPANITAIDKSIDIKNVTRHKMLGAGSFGQVWLASYGKAKEKQIFALKVQSKAQLIESYQAEGVVAEINIMSCLKSPFIIRLYSTFQDKHRVYMLTSLLQGGELDDVIGDGLDEDSAKFYAAGILEGLTYMHRRHIIHRDLKPENVMIDNLGYPVLIDLGFAKYVPEKTYTCCGTPMYMSPEVINFSGHDKGADHWSWATMVFEMVTGHYAFYNSGIDEVTMYKRICKGEFKVNGNMSHEFKFFLISMLVPDQTKRLGSRNAGWQDIFKLPWFGSLDLKALRRREVTAPWVPKLKNPLDASNFADVKNVQDKMKVDGPSLTEKQQKIFESFGPLMDLAEF